MSLAAYLQVTTTFDRREDAERVAALLIERRLAACVHISGPIESRYRWNGAIECALEYRCAIKTTGNRYAELEETLVREHPYETPEITAVKIVAGSSPYLAWIDEGTA